MTDTAFRARRGGAGAAVPAGGAAAAPCRPQSKAADSAAGGGRLNSAGSIAGRTWRSFANSSREGEGEGSTRRRPAFLHPFLRLRRRDRDRRRRRSVRGALSPAAAARRSATRRAGARRDVLLPAAPGCTSPPACTSSSAAAASRPFAEGPLAFSLRSTPLAPTRAAGIARDGGWHAGRRDGYAPRTLRRLAVKIDASAAGGKFPLLGGQKLAVNVGAERVAGNESYRLTLAGENKNLDHRGDRFLRRHSTGWRAPGGSRRFRRRSLAPFVLGTPAVPALCRGGARANFDADAALARQGALQPGGSRPPVDRLGGRPPAAGGRRGGEIDRGVPRSRPSRW